MTSVGALAGTRSGRCWRRGVGVLRQHGACVERVDGGGGCGTGGAHWCGDLGELVAGQDAVGIRVVRHYYGACVGRGAEIGR